MLFDVKRVEYSSARIYKNPMQTSAEPLVVAIAKANITQIYAEYKIILQDKSNCKIKNNSW